MNKKEEFIKMVKILIENAGDSSLMDETEAFNGIAAFEYFEQLQKEKEKPRVEITENGAKVLGFMQENFEKYNNIFKSKEIGEGLFISSRSVAGSMKKLISEGFVEKISSEPVTYSITERGKEKDLNNI
jgi:DNA-binding MarR family transcriptional regulator